MGREIACLIAGAAMLVLAGLAAATAQQPDACAGFYDAGKRDRSDDDVYIGVERPESAPACFLVPRAVIAEEFRRSYTDGETASFELDPVALLQYIGRTTHIAVGAEKRAVRKDKLDCLADPAPDSIAILGESPALPITIDLARSQMREVASDFPGYRRYVDKYGGDNYFAETRPEADVAFWCSGESEAEVCGMAGEYDQMRAGIRFFRKDMAHVEPERALRCVRAIGDLFRVGRQP
jgi:hypothetical protein